MELYTNKLMDEKLKEIEQTDMLVKEELKEIVEINGLYVLKTKYDKWRFDTSRLDKVEIEMMYNDVFLDDYYSGLTPKEKLQTAMSIMHQWIKEIREKYKNNAFIIIISCDEDYVKIRFHKEREDEENWLNEKVLESFIQPVMVLKIEAI